MTRLRVVSALGWLVSAAAAVYYLGWAWGTLAALVAAALFAWEYHDLRKDHP